MKNYKLMQMLLVGGLFLLLGLLIFNVVFVLNMGGLLDSKINEAKELNKPPEIELTTISSSCSDCFDIVPVIDTLKEANLNILKEIFFEETQSEAKELVTKYEIKRLPVVVITGEIDKVNVDGFKQTGDALVFDGVTPPFVDAITLQVIGKVSLVLIEDKGCDECRDLSTLAQNLKQGGVFFKEEKSIDYSSTEGRALIEKYDISTVPAILLSNDIDEYASVAQGLAQSNLKKAGNYYVIEAPAPYLDVASGELKGLIELTMLTDESCSECYDVNIHKQILARLGLAINKEAVVDISSAEGISLKEKYDIESVPTIILSGDMNAYPGLDTVWKTVGSIESDGSYVFREISAMGQEIIYKDLTTSEIIGAAPSSGEV